jgi:hypothetical protein
MMGDYSNLIMRNMKIGVIIFVIISLCILIYSSVKYAQISSAETTNPTAGPTTDPSDMFEKERNKMLNMESDMNKKMYLYMIIGSIVSIIVCIAGYYYVSKVYKNTFAETIALRNKIFEKLLR